jgi:hypothetical protein
LRKSGVQIDEEYIDNQFVFLGDTTWEMFTFEEKESIQNITLWINVE